MSCFERLPLLVVTRLLEYLNKQSLLNLRLVSCTTKAWISSFHSQNQGKLIDQFKVPVTSEDDIERIMSSRIQEEWSSFRISTVELSAPLLQSLFIFTASINSLEFKVISSSLLLQLIPPLENLQCLILRTLEVTSDFDSSRQPQPLIRLKTFCVDKLLFDSSHGTFYETFLSKSPSLTLLKPPSLFPCPSVSISFTELKELTFHKIIEPTQEFLLCQEKRRALLTVDVGNVNSHHFESLISTCTLMDVFATNVNDKQVKYTFLPTNDFLSRVLSLQEKIDDRRDLRAWRNLKSLTVRTSRCDVRNYYDCPSEIFPLLTHLTVIFDSISRNDPGFLALDKVISLLLQTQRLSVQELVLKWPQFGHDTPTSVVSVAGILLHFPRLRKLTVVGNDGWDS